jgi:hypothetical protein
VECYGLNMKCPPQAHVVKSRSPARGAVLGGAKGNFGRWDLIGGCWLLGSVLGVILSLDPSHLLSASCPP